MNPMHMMGSTIHNSYPSPTGSPYNSHIHPGSTSSMHFFSQPEWSPQSTLQFPQGQFQYAVPPSNPLTVSPVHTTQSTVRGANGMSGNEMVLLNHDNINRLKDLIAACRANPNILYMPELIFFKEYLESLRAKIPNKSDRQTTIHREQKLDMSPVATLNPMVEEDDDDPNSYLQIHMTRYTGERPRPFKCTQCDKAFTSRRYLKTHMITHTGADGTYKCNQCDKIFAYRKSLDYHIRAHLGVKPHSCKECGKAFSQKNRLEIHMRMHTGERPYECNQCGKSFKRYNTHKIHMTTHTDEKPHQCSQCDKTFRVKDQLTKHIIRNHTPKKRKYECTECGKAFIYKCSLTKHMTNCTEPEDIPPKTEPISDFLESHTIFS